jgi:hypothetical protein
MDENIKTSIAATKYRVTVVLEFVEHLGGRGTCRQLLEGAELLVEHVFPEVLTPVNIKIEERGGLDPNDWPVEGAGGVPAFLNHLTLACEEAEL